MGYSPAGVSLYGASDMAGNVWEWVNDWYNYSYYQSSPYANPTGPDMGVHRGLRGGSWINNSFDLRVAGRGSKDPSQSNNTTGFRCARALILFCWLLLCCASRW